MLHYTLHYTLRYTPGQACNEPCKMTCNEACNALALRQVPWGPLGIEHTVRVEVALLVNTSDMKADRALSPFMDTGANSCCGACNYNRADADARTPHSFLRVARGIDKPKWRLRTPVKLESLLDEMFALPKGEQRNAFGRKHGLRSTSRSVRRPV